VHFLSLPGLKQLNSLNEIRLDEVEAALESILNGDLPPNFPRLADYGVLFTKP